MRKEEPEEGEDLECELHGDLERTFPGHMVAPIHRVPDALRRWRGEQGSEDDNKYADRGSGQDSEDGLSSCLSLLLSSPRHSRTFSNLDLDSTYSLSFS